MSLTSYRAAPPRGEGIRREGVLRECRGYGGGIRELRLAGPGGDLLFRALRRSTIGAEGFHGRVRDGIGCYAPRYGHQAVQALLRRNPCSAAATGASAMRRKPRRGTRDRPKRVVRRLSGLSAELRSAGRRGEAALRRERFAALASGATGVASRSRCCWRNTCRGGVAGATPDVAAAEPGFRRMMFAAGRGRGKPLERLVPVSCAGCPASTSGLST